jgi:hypothetical protein
MINILPVVLVSMSLVFQFPISSRFLIKFRLYKARGTPKLTCPAYTRIFDTYALKDKSLSSFHKVGSIDLDSESFIPSPNSRNDNFVGGKGERSFESH